jgi:AcrR family transcriptional regulator
MSDTTRTTLVDAAAGLLAESGLSAVTLRAVGDRAGLSRSAPYRHFAGKEALLAAVAAEGMRELAGAVGGAVRKAPTPRTRLQRALLAQLRFAADQPDRYRLMWDGSVASPELDEAVEATHRGLLALVATLAPDGVDPHRLTALVFATLHGAAGLGLAGQLDGGTRWKARPEDVVRDLVALVSG